jgi:hypothetical protein
VRVIDAGWVLLDPAPWVTNTRNNVAMTAMRVLLLALFLPVQSTISPAKAATHAMPASTAADRPRRAGADLHRRLPAGFFPLLMQINRGRSRFGYASADGVARLDIEG